MSGLLGGSSQQTAQRFPVPTTEPGPAPAGSVGTPGTGNYIAPAATTATAPSAAEEAANAIINRETQRTERERISSIQQQLAADTIFRGRGYGLRSLLGSLGGGRRSQLGSG